MTLHLPSFAGKVRRLREMFGESVQDLSAATGLTLDAIQGLEDATRTPTGDEVLILADHFLCDFKFFISNDQLTPIERTEKLFRAHSQELSSADRWAVQEFLFLCETEAFLLHELERPPRVTYRFEKRDQYFKGHGLKAAQELRDALGHGPGDVPEVFLDIRRLGVHLFRRRLENQNISGLFVSHPEAGPCILVNYNEDVYRQRFTAAHEVAHAIFDVEDEFVVSFEGGAREDRRELRANAFAGAFLVPAELLASLPAATAWTGGRMLDLADQLGVNVRVLLIELVRGKRIAKEDSSQFEHLRLPRRAKEDPELPVSMSPPGLQRKRALLERGISGFYADLCFEAHTRGLFSAARLAEMLLVDASELPEIAALFRIGKI